MTEQILVREIPSRLLRLLISLQSLSSIILQICSHPAFQRNHRYFDTGCNHSGQYWKFKIFYFALEAFGLWFGVLEFKVISPWTPVCVSAAREDPSRTVSPSLLLPTSLSCGRQSMAPAGDTPTRWAHKGKQSQPWLTAWAKGPETASGEDANQPDYHQITFVKSLRPKQGQKQGQIYRFHDLSFYNPSEKGHIHFCYNFLLKQCSCTFVWLQTASATNREMRWQARPFLQLPGVCFKWSKGGGAVKRTAAAMRANASVQSRE